VFSLDYGFWLSKFKTMNTLTANLAIALIFFSGAELAVAQGQPGEHLTPFDQALELYQEFSGKTVLRSPTLPPLSEFNKPIPSSDTNGMRVVLENELLNKGIELIPLRDLIVMAVESGWKNSPVANYITTIKPPAKPESGSVPAAPLSNGPSPKGETIPPGTIDFRGADINQFLDIYAMLLNRSILRPTDIISSTFAMRTQTPFTKNDVIYLLEAALGLNGIASVEDGTNFVQVVPISRVGSLRLKAPQRIPNDPLLDPKTLPDFRYSHSFVPGKGFQSNGSGAVTELVAYYAELTGRTAVTSNKIASVPLIFRAQTPLTKPELLYALETTLALNGLAIIEVDDKTIRAGYRPDLEKQDGHHNKL
jgi:hypothetical protein